jgi:WD40 repeat protein
MIAGFTLKNPSYPEYVYMLDSGVMCLDFHPQHSSMLAVGLYDGTVLVYDFQKKSDVPIFKSTSKGGKHTDPVWQICWQKDDLDDNANFFSISSDGRVSQWTLLKNELNCTVSILKTFVLFYFMVKLNFLLILRMSLVLNLKTNQPLPYPKNQIHSSTLLAAHASISINLSIISLLLALRKVVYINVLNHIIASIFCLLR